MVFGNETIPESNKIEYDSTHSLMHGLHELRKRGDGMKIGFIGAGKMGFTLGKHLTEYEKNHMDSDFCVMGYFSQNPKSAQEAARFTDTNYYDSMNELVKVCDVIFLTVPDGRIKVVVDELAKETVSLAGKALIHTSGALSSRVFSGMGDQIYGYSLHPIYAVNSKTDSYLHFQDCYITIEGEGAYTERLICMFEKLGHTVKQISADCKAKYHASAVFVSNLVVGLYAMGSDLLTECGFSKEEAEKALLPLFANNAENISRAGIQDALTGPVSRCDIQTVEKHLGVLEGDSEAVYRILSNRLISIAREGKNMDEDYKQLTKVLQGDIKV